MPWSRCRSILLLDWPHHTHLLSLMTFEFDSIQKFHYGDTHAYTLRERERERERQRERERDEDRVRERERERERERDLTEFKSHRMNKCLIPYELFQIQYKNNPRQFLICFLFYKNIHIHMFILRKYLTKYCERLTSFALITEEHWLPFLLLINLTCFYR